MTVQDLIKIYENDSIVQLLAEKTKNQEHTQIKGLAGSLDAFMVAAVSGHMADKSHLIILNDKEDAAYFYNDLQNLIGEERVFFFPMSYKKAYQYEEIENANVLQRAEILNMLNNQAEVKTTWIVSYPEALFEKVINRKSLLANTFVVKVGNQLDLDFMQEFLLSYEFEKTDFVYEAGQFSIRGGIIDVYSYASEFPCRIELFGNEVESLRFFNPETQLSEKVTEQINIIPDVQSKMIQETRESFFQFIRQNTLLWIKDVEFVLESIENCFNRVGQEFQQIVERSGGIQVIENPEQLFETRRGFLNELKNFKTVEFGSRMYFKAEDKLQYPAKPQPSFNKDFKRLIDTLHDFQGKGYTTLLAAESLKQLSRLENIIQELDPFIQFNATQTSLREGFFDENAKIVCFTDHQIFDRFHKYKIRDKFSKSKALTLKELKTLQVGDYVTHVDYGIGRFAGLEKVDANGREQEAIRLIYRDNDLLYVSIYSLHKVSKYSGKEGSPPNMSKLGSPEWENKKSKVKKQVKDIAKELIALYAKRRQAKGFAYGQDTYLQVELESSFLYEDTPDQAKATNDVKRDMEQVYPMDRLVCGDVGFGKTEIAIRAAFKAVNDSKQVAVLVPTTILAMQHNKTFSDRLAKLPCSVADISRFKTTKEVKDTLEKVKAGKVDILIGTHRILNKDIVFKDLGLLIIDEEQKFGVKAKDRIKEMKLNVDVLTLTATPIPRTLHFSLMGARDLSVIATPPPNRQPVTTELKVFSEEFIRDAISYELQRGGQVFFVHNRVGDIESIANIILRLVPDAKIGVAHGQMEGDRLEKVMMKFIEGDYDILISTNIIESGLDIPNANTIIINHAHYFGMSDLHQMRGRVGRSNKKAFCYLLTPPLSVLTKDARKRLQTLEEFSDLGDGFKVAMRDLDIRGAGNLLGAEQSGFINDVGYEMYHKILDEAVQELKETEFKALFETELNPDEFKQPDCQIETDLDVLIPETFVGSISERLSLYNQLDNIKCEKELDEFRVGIIDRFGKLPFQVENLIELVKVRWLAEGLGVEKLILKNNILKATFVSSERADYYQSTKFGKVLDYVQNNHRTCSLKEIKNKLTLTLENVKNIKNLHETLRLVSDF